MPEKGEATLNALVVTFNGESLTDADISWGDKKHKTTDGVITSQGNGVFSITGAHVYKKEGSFTVTLTVTFEDASTASATGTVTVTERHDGEKPDRDSDRG